MDENKILETIKNLSHAQGSYGQLYDRLTDGSEEAEDALNYLVQQNFKDAVDLVLFLES